jgi:WS/DGAT/MGAT family acyltransferase
VLARPLPFAQLQALIDQRFLAFERFRRVPVADATSASWTEARRFDITDHVLRTSVARGAGQAELERLVGELASTPFKQGIPLWSFHLVEDYQDGCALIVRVHHCYADGIALLQVLLSLADGAASREKVRVEPSAPGGLPSSLALAGAAAPALRGLLSGLIPEYVFRAVREGADVIEKGVHYALHPGEGATLAQDALGLVGELARLGALADDPPTRLKQPLTGIRRAAWAEPLSLEEVRTVGRLLGCTVNDVLVASLAGALGHYLEAHGDKVSGRTLRASVPVNLRPPADAPQSLGNHFGLIFVPVPIGIHHPLERLYAVHASMQALKASAQAVATLGLLTLVGNLPAAFEERAIGLFTAKASLVASNLCGPREPLLIGGIAVSQVLFWVPQGGSIGMGVSMLSYAGRVQFGIIADRQVVPDPRELVELIGVEFERLVYLVLFGAGSL